SGPPTSRRNEASPHRHLRGGVMKLPRRNFLHLAAGAAALAAVSRIAWAPSYPTRPVRIIVSAAPSGSADIIARVMGQWLSERLGQPFIIENRPGGGGNIGVGYTLLQVSSRNAINATLYTNPGFNFMRDIAPVASIDREPLVMAVNPSVPARTVSEFIAYAKANPGKISMASAGNGTPSHVSGELFNMMAGVNMVHVPYRGGGPALVDLLTGQVQVMFASMSSSIEYVRAGNLRALASPPAPPLVAGPAFPRGADVGRVSEAPFWPGRGAPKNPPADIVDKLNKEINAGLGDPKLKARFADLGAAAFPGLSSDFAKFIATETEKWGKVVKFAGIKPE